MAFDDEYISKKEAILAVTHDGCTANVVGVLYHLPAADVVPKSEYDEVLSSWQKIHDSYDADCIEHYKYGRAEVAREIFEEIEKSFIEYYDKTITYSSPTLPLYIREAAGFSLNEMFMKIAELKKKYTEDTNNEN